LSPAVGVDRQGLTAFLVDEAARRFPDAITFHFDVKPDLDLQQRCVRFVSRESNQRTGSPMELSYDLLVGADGAGSSVRAALELTVPDVTVRTRFFD
jgi:2-polyprenyl-6-methoxyphenol hydroxylase-like FAD-dependent oxidoreductase